MKKSAKIWLVVAIIICILTTILNFTEKRYVSVLIALISIISLFILLLKEKKVAFKVLVLSYLVSCLYSIFTNLSTGNIIVNILMSIVGSAIIPLVTYLFIKSDYKKLV